MKPPGSRRRQSAISIILLAAVLGAYSACERGKSTPVRAAGQDRAASPADAVAPRARSGGRAPFDFYLLALTVHPAFCADGHAQTPECRAAGTRALVIHGLWPEKLEPRTYPHDCPAPPLSLDSGLAQELLEWMPGMAQGLHEHEWREHGGCSGLDADVYFRRALELARVMDMALHAKLTTLAGGQTTAADLRAVANLYEPGIGVTFTFHCRALRAAPPAARGQPYLLEVRQCVDDDGPGGAPGTPLDCASVNRRDQGCGRAFWIADRRT